MVKSKSLFYMRRHIASDPNEGYIPRFLNFCALFSYRIEYAPRNCRRESVMQPLRVFYWDIYAKYLGCMPSGDGKGVNLFVADSGRGIPQDQLSRIFDRFYKIDSFIQGAGLGLPVCKTLAEGLGGMIRVRSHPGGGGRVFHYFFPRILQRSSVPTTRNNN